MLSLIIATDVRLYRDGLRELLGHQDCLTVMGAASDSSTALQHVLAHRPTAVLVDSAMSECVSLVREIVRRSTETRVVMLGVGDTDSEVAQAAETGAVGLVTKDASLAELVTVIQGVSRGEFACSPRTAGRLLRRLASLAGHSSTAEPVERLTGREAQILRLIQEGLSNKEIATRLGIAVATVKNHVHRLLGKLRVHRRLEAAVGLLTGHFP